MTSRQRKKQRWFDTGMAAFETVFGSKPPGYVCPLCVRAFTEIDDLSFEHAPPRRIRGREVALTCCECNHSSGHTLDAELGKAHDVREWERGERSLRAEFIFRGIPLNVDVTRAGGVVSLTGLPQWNDPANTAAWDAAWANESSGSGQEQAQSLTMSFRFPGYREREARVALLRSAYIVAFAALGYRYVLRPTLNIVREQIRNPDVELIERFSLHRRDPLEGRAIAWVERPRALESVIVQLGEHLVFLPGLKADGGIYERLMTRKRWPPSLENLRSGPPTVLEWPTRPMHAFDVPPP